MIYFTLAYEFFKIGLFSIGGGMATLPFLMDLAGKHDWFTIAQVADMAAISESTPGPLGVNMATFAGYHAAGIPGALIATLALTAPALIIIILIAKFLENFSENQTVQAVFYGIRPTVAALIGYAVWELLQITMVTTTEKLPDPSRSDQYYALYSVRSASAVETAAKTSSYRVDPCRSCRRNPPQIIRIFSILKSARNHSLTGEIRSSHSC